jgi:serine/threonine-protein kinase
VKPANLFVSRKGATTDFVKLLDFGLVKRWTAREDEASLTSPAHAALSQTGIGQLVGTPAYLPPEAALGESAVDRRADLYSLGCVAYFLLTGKLVFQETSVMAMAVAHVTREPEPPSTRTDQPIPPELEALVLACLQKDRTLRPATAAELRLRLAAVPLAQPWSRERAAAWWKRHLG